MKKILNLFFCLLLLTTITGCKKKQDDDIYIVFTNDVHCAIEGDIGYSGVAAYKKELEAEHKYVSLVDVGDFSNGAAVGALTSGYGPTMIMNEAKYDVVCLGNHEFDHSMKHLFDNILINANFDVVTCNVGYSGKKENILKDLKPYVVKEYGNTKVAFVGVVTPYTATEASPTAFMEDGELVYDFYFGDDKENFYNNLQNVINSANKEADYVILLSHLGYTEAYKPYNSIDICQNTYGIDVILDAHSHSEVVGNIHQNAKGEDIQIWQTGTELSNIGQIILTKDHTIEGMLISNYEKKDDEVNNAIEIVNNELNDTLNTIIGNTPFDLTIEESSNGKNYRVVRSRETNLGNLCVDSYRYVFNTDIAIVNGGAIRTNIKAGDITTNNALDVHPFLSNMAIVKVSGQTILDMLEYSVANTLPYTNNGENSTGEFGGFLQVSGLKFTVDTSIPSPVIIENEMFVDINENVARRVSDVYVEKNNNWISLNPDEFYTIASSQYILTEHGNGYTMFDDAEIITKEGPVDTNCLIDYIVDGLNGIIPDNYKDVEGRIIIK